MLFTGIMLLIRALLKILHQKRFFNIFRCIYDHFEIVFCNPNIWGPCNFSATYCLGDANNTLIKQTNKMYHTWNQIHQDISFRLGKEINNHIKHLVQFPNASIYNKTAHTYRIEDRCIYRYYHRSHTSFLNLIIQSRSNYQLSVVKQMVQATADTWTSPPAIAVAVEQNNYDIVNFLLHHDPKTISCLQKTSGQIIDMNEKQQHILHYACQNQHPFFMEEHHNVIKLLLEHKFCKDQINKIQDNRTPLSFVTTVKTVKLLIEKNANVNKIFHNNQLCTSVLAENIRFNRTKVVTWLLENTDAKYINFFNNNPSYSVLIFDQNIMKLLMAKKKKILLQYFEKIPLKRLPVEMENIIISFLIHKNDLQSMFFDVLEASPIQPNDYNKKSQIGHLSIFA
ncbi:MAG: hypothetical protein Dasosvirus3_6 [Dasosvirus sp.]|uniref:Uncharacterized protein n=1 Tax=Dasosvirus sp. TaxID=2487764 RepID=A0A3G4ZRD2_9VIRU|nr:MAG: hypothetical protein Dasosvirus3_6 [Dasosvirus sp.]